MNQNRAAVFVAWGNTLLADKTLKTSLVHNAQTITEPQLLKSGVYAHRESARVSIKGQNA